MIQYEKQYDEFGELILELERTKSVEESMRLIEKQIRQEQSNVVSLKE